MDEKPVSSGSLDFSPFLGGFSYWVIDQCERIQQKKPLFGIPFRKNNGTNVVYSLVSSIMLSLRDMLEVQTIDGKQFVKPLAAPVLLAAVIHTYVDNDAKQWKLQFPQGDEDSYRVAGTLAFLAQGLFLMPESFIYSFIETVILNAKTAFLLDPEMLNPLLVELGITNVNEFISNVYTNASVTYLEANPPKEE